MKKVLFISLLMLSFFSCERDDSLSPLSIFDSGNYVRLDITSKCLNIQDPSVKFGGNLTNPGGKSVKFNLYVRLTDEASQTSFGDFKLVKTITSFPVTLEVSIADIATALSLNVSDLKLEDQFRFYGESFDVNGVRSDYSSLSGTVRSNIASYKPAFRFRTQIKDNVFFANLDDVFEFDNYTVQ